jgi:hypothetical protein
VLTLTMPDSTDDPWLTAQIDAAVAPYKDRLSEAEIAWMREQLAEVLAGDPSASTLVRRARPITVDESGEVRRGPGGKVVQTPVGSNVVSIKRSGKKVG